MLKIVRFPGRTADRAIAGIERARARTERRAESIARRVIADVRREGDSAASRIVQTFDRASIPADQMRMAVMGCEIDRSVSDAIDLAIGNVERFHRAQLPRGYRIEEEGVDLTHRVRPLRRVGIYAPGGSAVYLSTLIMCAVPARIAGVEEIVVATTPTAAARPEFLECCSRLGISEIYRAGGPAGVAAMALGTATFGRVDKIVGPGNAYVTAAKKLLAGKVGIDMLAGPTELVLIADASAEADRVAADLLAQAEHGVDSAVICVVFDQTTADEVSCAVERQLAVAGSDTASESIRRNGLIVIASSAEDAVSLTNRIAPEHLSLHWQQAPAWLEQFENCGAMFVGAESPVAVGDYVAGPNHVLPTSGSARFTSPLGVYDFVKRSNVVTYSAEGVRQVAAAGVTIAQLEGLPLHARSLAVRLSGGDA